MENNTENNMEDNIQTLIDELSSFQLPAPNTHSALEADSVLNKQDTEQYFLNKAKAVIEVSVGAVQDLTQAAVHSGDARDVDALAKLIASTAQLLDSLNKTNLIDKKADRDEKLEKIRIEAKKEIVSLQGPQQNFNNSQVVIASREEVIAALMKNKEEILTLEDK